jgi:hypothetical protein
MATVKKLTPRLMSASLFEQPKAIQCTIIGDVCRNTTLHCHAQ